MFDLPSQLAAPSRPREDAGWWSEGLGRGLGRDGGAGGPGTTRARDASRPREAARSLKELELLEHDDAREGRRDLARPGGQTRSLWGAASAGAAAALVAAPSGTRAVLLCPPGAIGRDRGAVEEVVEAYQCRHPGGSRSRQHGRDAAHGGAAAEQQPAGRAGCAKQRCRSSRAGSEQQTSTKPSSGSGPAGGRRAAAFAWRSAPTALSEKWGCIMMAMTQCASVRSP